MTAALIAAVLASGLGGQVDAQAVAPPNDKAAFVARIVMQSTLRDVPTALRAPLALAGAASLLINH